VPLQSKKRKGTKIYQKANLKNWKKGLARQKKLKKAKKIKKKTEA
jgi:hypothetical protein